MIEELKRAQFQAALTAAIVSIVEQTDTLSAIVQAIAQAFGRHYSADVCLVQLVEADTLSTVQGVYGTSADTSSWLTQEPLTQAAIATKTLQINPNISENPTLSEAEPYHSFGMQSSLVTPILFRGQILAVLMLLWRQPQSMLQEQLTLFNLSISQLALALAFVC